MSSSVFTEPPPPVPSIMRISGRRYSCAIASHWTNFLCSAASAAPSSASEPPLLAALGHDPVSLDALVARTGWPAAQLQAQLLELELAGEVARLPGGLFQRIGHA